MSAEVVFDWLEYHGRATPDAMAVSDLPSGRVFGYGQFNERATRLATGLRKAFGVGKTDRVAMLAHNSTDLLETLFACWKLGAVFMPLNWRLTPEELLAVIDNGEPRVLICDAELESLVAGARGMRVVRRPQQADCAYEALVTNHSPAVMMAGITYDDINMVVYTSGTTGPPKGVIYNHRMSMNNAIHAALHAGVTREARMLANSPLFHPVELCGAVSLFHWGGAVIVTRNFDVAQTLRLMTDPASGITHTIGAPAHYVALSRAPDFEGARFATLKMLGVGDAPVSSELLALWSRKGAPLSQWYGLAEAFSVALVPPHRAPERLDTAGFPMMHAEVRIGDEFGRQFTRGEIGEIQVRGPGVTPGYWRNPDATRAAFVGGWLRTGDVGRIDADGALHVINRTHDTFVSGGEIIYPALIERVIAGVDGVERVAVIGTGDPRWGKVGLALISVRPGATVTEADVIAHCRERLGRYQVPRYVRVVDQLPLTLQGEVWKRELRTRYANFQG